MRSIEVFIDSCSAKSSIALELLDRGLGPASESLEVSEGRIVIVVSVPQLLRCDAGTCSETAHNGLPHVSCRIDGWHLSVALDAVDDLGQEGTVSCVVAAPATACAGVGFNVDPHHAVEVAGNGRHHLVDLS